MKYIFWFAFILVVIGNLTKKQQNAYNASPSYTPVSRTSTNPGYYAPNTFQNFPASKEIKPMIEKKQPQKQREKYDSYETTGSYWSSQSRVSENASDLFRSMEEMKSSSNFNQVDWKKLERESDARFEAMSRSGNNNLNLINSLREMNAPANLSSFSTLSAPSSIWTNSGGSPNISAPAYYYPGTSNSTYTSGGTEYYTNETYSKSGNPKVKRNMTTRSHFLHSQGYDKVPEGYEVDHIVPLSLGGSDTEDNMQLLTREQHRQKTANERGSTSHTGLPPSYFSTPSLQPSIYSNQTTTLPGSSREIQTGPRGGKYYVNPNGNKTYIKD
jgi:hypothetical protein